MLQRLGNPKKLVSLTRRSRSRRKRYPSLKKASKIRIKPWKTKIRTWKS
jgi:hypothetical protein